MSDNDRNVPTQQFCGFVNHILTLIFYFVKVEELDSPDTHRQVRIDINERQDAISPSIAPIPDATAPCHSSPSLLGSTLQIWTFFGIFKIDTRDHVRGMAYGRLRRFLYNKTIILKQIRLKHKSKTLF